MLRRYPLGRVALPFILGMLGVLGACSLVAPPTRVLVSRTPIGDHALHEEGEALPVRPWQLVGDPAGITHGEFVVKGELEWRTLWPTTPPERIPLLPGDLDFSREMLLVVAPADSRVAASEVADVVDTDARGVNVYVTESVPGPDCPPPQTEHNYALARVRRIDGKEVRFHLDAIPGDACGTPPKAYVACRENGTTLPFRDKLDLPAGATASCLASGLLSSRPIFDLTWSFGAQPSGTTAKIAVGAAGKGATFTPDVFGTYTVVLEVTDDLSRTGKVTANVDMMPPGDALVLQMAWTKFSPGDDPAVFPHVELHAYAMPPPEPPKNVPMNAVHEATQTPAAPAIPWGTVKDCSREDDKSPVWCMAKSAGPTTVMKLDPGAAKEFAVALHYLEDRRDGQPVPCVRAYRNGKLQAEACDPFARKRGTWLDSATLDGPTGRTLQAIAIERAAASATTAKPDGGAGN